MTVNQLRRWLAGLDGDTPVVLATDAEGNGFRGLDEVGEGFYRPPARGYGEGNFWPVDDDNVPAGAEHCLVLWPG